MKLLSIRVYNTYPRFLNLFFLVFVLIMLINENIKAQDELNVISDNWLQHSDAPNSLYHYLSDQAFDLIEDRNEKVSRLNSLAMWQQRQNWIKETLLDIVGPFPEKTPLNAKIIRKIDKIGYRVEHIVYESQPGFYVTSSLFLPEGLKKRKKAPAVIYCSGHSSLGYRGDVYQHVILNLVKKGFIVFAFDPVGQGERFEYYDPKAGKPISGISQHSYPGTQAFISGSSQARYMIWDGIRAVDYLLTRKEVDHARIGITGRSGGGTQSSYIAAMDDRIYAVAPENYLTSFTRLLQSIGPQDAEQNMFNAIEKGIDHADLLIVRAPKPALMITTTRDIFNIQGVYETENEVSRIYRAYDKANNFSRVEDDAPHASTKKNREAMYAFFQKHLNNPGNSEDEKTQILTVEEIQVTSTGQISTSMGGETVFSINKRETEELAINLQTSRNDLNSHLPRVLNSAKKLSGYREPKIIDKPVFTGRFQREEYIIEKYFVKGEGNYVIPYLLLKPDNTNNKAIIYLHPSDKSKEAVTGGEIEWFVKKGFTVLTPDLLGIGEIGKNDTLFNHPYLRKWFASILIGRSIVGIQTGDVVKLFRLLKKDSEIKEVYGFARGKMSPALLHAAAFEPNITRVALVEPYSSYLSIVMNRFYNPGFIYSTVAGALEAYDLPDLAACLAPRKLFIVGVTNGLGNISDNENLNKDIAIIKNVYQNKNAEGQLNIITEELTKNTFNLFMDWID